MDPLQHRKSTMKRIWGPWVDKCVSPAAFCFETCDRWWLSDKIPQELFFLSRQSKLPLSYSCPYHPKVPAKVQFSRPAVPDHYFLLRTATKQLVKVTVAPGVCPSAVNQGKTLPCPFTKKNVFHPLVTFLSWAAFQTFPFLSECGGSGTKHLTPAYCHSYLFPGWQFFCTIEPFLWLGD